MILLSEKIYCEVSFLFMHIDRGEGSKTDRVLNRTMSLISSLSPVIFVMFIV